MWNHAPCCTTQLQGEFQVYKYKLEVIALRGLRISLATEGRTGWSWWQSCLESYWQQQQLPRPGQGGFTQARQSMTKNMSKYLKKTLNGSSFCDPNNPTPIGFLLFLHPYTPHAALTLPVITTASTSFLFSGPLLCQSGFKICCQGEIKPDCAFLSQQRAGQHGEGRSPCSKRH